jgi:hypothetical protein
MDKVQKHDSFKCNTPSSEPFRIDLGKFILSISSVDIGTYIVTSYELVDVYECFEETYSLHVHDMWLTEDCMRWKVQRQPTLSLGRLLRIFMAEFLTFIDTS